VRVREGKQICPPPKENPAPKKDSNYNNKSNRERAGERKGREGEGGGKDNNKKGKRATNNNKSGSYRPEREGVRGRKKKKRQLIFGEPEQSI
jgi:hypothetical protein